MSARVSGHSLVAEGAAMDANGKRITHWWFESEGEGRGLCSCGLLSDALPSTNARKRWHRAHKLALLSKTTN